MGSWQRGVRFHGIRRVWICRSEHQHLLPCFDGHEGFVDLPIRALHALDVQSNVMEKPELAKDSLFAKAADRIANIDKLIEVVETWLVAFPDLAEPLALIEQAGIPCAKVNTTAEVLEDEQLKERGMITELETPDGLPTRKIMARGNPFKFSEVKAELKKSPKRRRPSPAQFRRK